MAIEIAAAYLPIVPTFRGIKGELEKGLLPVASRVGVSAGKNISDGVSKGIAKPDLSRLENEVVQAQKRLEDISAKSASSQEASARKVEAAQQQVAKAMRDSELAAQKLATAESEAARLQESGSVSAGKMERAQLAILTARNRLADQNASMVNAEKRLADVQSAHADSVKRGNAEYMAQESVLRGARDELEKTRNSISEMETAAEQSSGGIKGAFQRAFSGIRGGASKAADDIDSEMGGAGEKGASGMVSAFDGAFKKLPGLFAAVGLGATISASFTEAMDQTNLKGKIAAQLDLDPATAKKAGSAASQLFTQGYGESMGDVYEATSAALSSIKGLSSQSEGDIGRITGYAMNLSDAFGIDVADAVGSVGVMINNGLVPDADKGFDLMTGAMQKVPAAFRGEMTDAITEYSKHFAGLGISGEDAVGMLVKASENGSIGIDKMGDAVKEFQIRSTDMSKSTTGAYEAIGLDAEEMTGKLLAGGDTAEEAFGQIIGGLMGMDDPTAQSQAALALFGTQIEDLGVDKIPEFLGTLDPAGDKFDSLDGAASKMGDTLHDTAANKVEAFKRSIGQGFVDVAAKAIDLFDGIKGAVAPIGDFLRDTVDKWGPFAAGLTIASAGAGLWAASSSIAAGATGLWAGAMTLLRGAFTFLTGPIGLTITIVGALIGAVIYAYQNFEWFRNGVNFVWDWIKQVIAGFVDWWTQVAWPAIMTGLQWLGDKFVWLYQNVVQPVWGFITAVISGFVTWLTTVAIPWVSGALQTLGGWFSWLNDTIIQPVWYAIRVAIAAAVAVIMTIFQGLWWVISNTLGPIFLWLWNSIISPVFTWIAEKIGGFGSWFSTVALPLITGSLDILKIAFQWLWEKVSAVFTWIWNKGYAFGQWLAVTLTPYIQASLDILKLAFHWLWDKVSAVFTWSWNKIQAFANWFNQTILPYIRAGLDVLKQAFHWLWEKVSAVFSWIGDKIARTWAWIRDAIFNPLISFLKQTLGPAWQWLSDKVGQVWDWISDKIRRTWNWTRDNVLSPLMRFVEDDVVGAFTRAKDGIGRVWDKIKDKVKEPVQFVVDTVINGGFIKNYNKVAEKFKVDKLPEVHLPSGFATGGIIPGYARGGILPGYQSKKKDELLTPMRKGEGVLVPEAVRALGADFIHGVNGAANSGGVRAAEEWKKKHGVASGDGHDHGAPAGAYGWAGSSFRTSGSMPPSGGSGIWGSFQAAASRAGAMNFPDKSFLGASTKRAAQAWMGRSALNVNTDGKGPSVTVGTGNAGPWGFNQGSSVQVNPSAPSNMILSILMHEFGHALSLDHTNNGASVMHPAIAGVKSPSGSDYAALRSAWGKPGEGVKTYDVNGGESGFNLRDVLQPIWDATVGKMVNASMDGLAKMFPGNHFVGIGTNAVKQLVQSGFDFIVGNGEGADDGGSSGGDWTGTVKDALKRTGLPVRDDYVNAWKRQIQSESGGNPKAVQGGYTDINSITGDLAKGLVQVIGSTFNAYRDPSLPNDRFNPLANLVAAMNYAKARYGTSGMLGAIGRGHGYALGGIVDFARSGFQAPGLYDDGGMISGKGLRLIDHQRSTPDYVLTSKQWDAMYQIAERSATDNGTSQQINITVPEREGISPDTFGARIGEGLAWQLSKMGV
ncbi:transglycosylase SLT domain-containing protein [Rothia amarae]|uniref:Transglycosylase SLT domain-containing protein n=1 Tax=Rothia amarae TaxID=169480 RepID=A0A7H2BLX4_9MICC|nr:phage tail tape measure protein [Rothia amarae]QNV40670.1 transglycosylase SLT domain-containing protein [Rothia amarae]